MSEFWRRVIEAVNEVEAAYGSGSGAAKREAAVAILNAAFDIPGIPEQIEAIVYGYFVDLICYLYNNWWGRVWPKTTVKADGNSH